MTEVTRTEKNAVIAAWIEPMPSAPSTFRAAHPLMGRECTPSGRWIWTPKWEGSSQAVSVGLMFGPIEQLIPLKVDNGSWHPADFFTCESASAAALEKVIDHCHGIEVHYSPAGSTVIVLHLRNASGDWYTSNVYGATPKAATFEAAYLCAIAQKGKA